MISDILGKEVNYKFVEDRLGHDKAYRLNSSKLDVYYLNKKKQMFIKNISDYLLEQYK
jgi:dTDP-D-glucose 4,6-dehydratase